MTKSIEKPSDDSDTRNLQVYIEDAKCGDVKASRQLIWEFINATRLGADIPPILLSYFADCFGAYLNKYNCDNDCWKDAMNTVATPGKQLNTEDRDEYLLFDYASHLNAGGTRKVFILNTIQSPPAYWTGKKPTESTIKGIIDERKRKDQARANEKKILKGQRPTGREIEDAVVQLPLYRALSAQMDPLFDDELTEVEN